MKQDDLTRTQSTHGDGLPFWRVQRTNLEGVVDTYVTTHIKKVKADIPPQSYGTSLAIWDHTVLPATRYK